MYIHFHVSISLEHKMHYIVRNTHSNPVWVNRGGVWIREENMSTWTSKYKYKLLAYLRRYLLNFMHNFVDINTVAISQSFVVTISALKHKNNIRIYSVYWTKWCYLYYHNCHSLWCGKSFHRQYCVFILNRVINILNWKMSKQ